MKDKFDLSVSKYPDTKGHTINLRGYGKSIASVKHHDPATQARLAALMATAPELYDALDGLVGWMERHALPTLGDDSDGGQALLASAQAALGEAWT